MFTLTTPSRRLFIASALACATGLVQAQAPADYPSRPVTVIVPFAPGGSVDSAARLVLQGLSERLKQNFVVENVAGASGTIGTQRAARATADGYTLLFAVASPINVAPLVKPSIVRYDALKDFVPVATVASSPFVLIGSPQLGASSTSEVLTLARQSPGKLNYGTDGVGTSMHLAAEIIKLAGGVDIQHVPFRNGPQVLTDLAAGRIELAVMPLSLAQPFIADNRVKAYGVTSQKRWGSMPELPALSETPGLQAVDVDSWYGLLAPAGTPAPIVARLATALGEVLADPALANRMQTGGLKPLFVERDAFGRLLQRERDNLAAAVKAAAIQPE
jgi:tripartite-type tricarboxylate transporter receptor subunit TctC